MEHFIICVTDFQSGCLKKFLELGKGQPVADTRFSAFQPITYITAWTIDGQSCVKLADNSAENHYTGTSNLWLRVGEACMRSDKSGESNDQTSSPDDSQSEGRFLLAEKLLEAADGLLTHGCCVEVVISLSVRSLQVIQAESLVMLYASLKRLRIWHNAAIKVLVNEGSYTESNPLLEWMTHLEAEVIGRVKELTVPSHLTLWRGQALVLDSRRNVLLCLRDMCLEWSPDSEDEPMESGDTEVRLGSGVTQRQQAYINSRNLRHLSLSHTLEVLEEVDVVTVPSFLLSPCSLVLKQNGGTSVNEFLQNVHNNNEVGYILRIGYLKKTEVKTCEQGLRSTKHWKEALSANAASIFDVMESDEVMDGYLHLLLTSGLGFNTPGNECTAYVLRSPEEVNGGILEMLHRNWLKSPAMEDVGAIDMGSMIQGLPVWNLTDLGCIADYIVKAQRDVLQAWLDERRSRSQSVCMTETEVMSILQGVHRHVMEVTKAERVGQAGTDVYKPYSLWTYAHGTSAENMDWPERQALKLQESSSRKMSRFMSSDSLQQSSPIQPTDEAEKSVNVGDFLKLFAADGSAAGTNLSILQGKEGSSVLSKISSFDDRELSWPECKDVKFHDIYYNNGRRCEKLELQYSKLKQRHLGSETRSTISVSSSGILDHSCSAIKTKAVRKVCQSPVRRSPRKHAPPRDRLSTGVIRDKRRIELCPKTSKEPGVKQKPLGDPLTQLTVERPTRSLPDDKKKKTGPTRRVLKEDVPPAEEPTADQAADKKKSSRSDRHKRRLQQIVHDVLKAKGVRSGDDLYKACSTKLYTVTKIYAMDLPTSRNLVADMTKIAEGQVQQVIDLEMMKRKST